MSRHSELTYTPAWWVPGAHAQTLWGKLCRRPRLPPLRRERWSTPDDDVVELWRLEATREDAPHLLLLHGLEGTLRSHYIRGMLHQARIRGWGADLLLFRGCGGEMNRARRLYHSGETSDLALVVRRLVAEAPARQLCLAGFSLGGNVLLKWLGELGGMVPPAVVAAAAVSVPFDLLRGSRAMERGFARVYTRHFLRTLRAKARAKLAQFPGAFEGSALRHVRTLHAFDDLVTAPLHGFRSADDYYRRSSSLQYLKDVRTPTLLVNSADDPFLPSAVLDEVRAVARGNDCLHLAFTQRGGHVGFVAGRRPWSPRYHAEQRVLRFFSERSARSWTATHPDRVRMVSPRQPLPSL